jgi:hypothetical protein
MRGPSPSPDLVSWTREHVERHGPWWRVCSRARQQNSHGDVRGKRSEGHVEHHGHGDARAARCGMPGAGPRVAVAFAQLAPLSVAYDEPPSLSVACDEPSPLAVAGAGLTAASAAPAPCSPTSTAAPPSRRCTASWTRYTSSTTAAPASRRKSSPASRHGDRARDCVSAARRSGRRAAQRGRGAASSRRTCGPARRAGGGEALGPRATWCCSCYARPWCCSCCSAPDGEGMQRGGARRRLFPEVTIPRSRSTAQLTVRDEGAVRHALASATPC